MLSQVCVTREMWACVWVFVLTDPSDLSRCGSSIFLLKLGPATRWQPEDTDWSLAPGKLHVERGESVGEN